MKGPSSRLGRRNCLMGAVADVGTAAAPRLHETSRPIRRRHEKRCDMWPSGPYGPCDCKTVRSLRRLRRWAKTWAHLPVSMLLRRIDAEIERCHDGS